MKLYKYSFLIVLLITLYNIEQNFESTFENKMKEIKNFKEITIREEALLKERKN